MPYFGDEDVTGVDVSAFDQVPGELEAECAGEAAEACVCHLLHTHRGSKRGEVEAALSRVLHMTPQQVTHTYERAEEAARLSCQK